MYAECVEHLRAGLAEEPPMWCDGAAVDLLAVMAGQVPQESLRRPLLLPPVGIVLFAHDLPTEWQGVALAGEGDGTAHAPLRAVTWQMLEFADDDGPVVSEAVVVTGWIYREPGLARFGGRKVRMRELWPSQVVEVIRVGEPTEKANSGYRLLHALAALVRSPLAVDEQEDLPVAPARRAAARPLSTPRLRRLYLRRPEVGRRELEELRAEHGAGTSPRGHWVRGHWKEQWYPSTEEHRLVWIEGYPRGDWGLGKVDGPAVLVARGGTPEQEPAEPSEDVTDERPQLADRRRCEVGLDG